MFKSPQYCGAIFYVNYARGSVSSNLESQKQNFHNFQFLVIIQHFQVAY